MSVVISSDLDSEPQTYLFLQSAAQSAAYNVVLLYSGSVAVIRQALEYHNYHNTLRNVCPVRVSCGFLRRGCR